MSWTLVGSAMLVTLTLSGGPGRFVPRKWCNWLLCPHRLDKFAVVPVVTSCGEDASAMFWGQTSNAQEAECSGGAFVKTEARLRALQFELFESSDHRRESHPVGDGTRRIET